jgi:hypothetical protein
MTESILRALSMAFAMGWELLWPEARIRRFKVTIATLRSNL